jgi:hypothetical protein
MKHHNCSMSIECDHEIPLPPLPKMISTIPGTDFDRLSEKYWGEILERTFSSNSLHALQHSHHQTQMHNNNGKQHHFYGNNTFGDVNLRRSDTNLYYSNSEPRLCEHDLHDINCAKNKAFFGAFNRMEDI